jgi:excisionase family DNA binding protein
MAPILTQREIAQRLRVSLDTVRRLCAAGELRVVRVSPRRIGILASEEERYLREHQGPRQEPVQAPPSADPAPGSNADEVLVT